MKHSFRSKPHESSSKQRDRPEKDMNGGLVIVFVGCQTSCRWLHFCFFCWENITKRKTVSIALDVKQCSRRQWCQRWAEREEKETVFGPQILNENQTINTWTISPVPAFPNSCEICKLVMLQQGHEFKMNYGALTSYSYFFPHDTLHWYFDTSKYNKLP